MNYINKHRDKYKAQVFYSTPSLYINTINQLENVTYPTKYDDFFPYADRNDAYWVGYFTSRVALKNYVKWLGRYI